MARQKRILYEGGATDRRMMEVIAKGEPMHYRINTIGDIPNDDFLSAVLTGIMLSGSTSFGYTHWQPEHPLGYRIREYSKRYWNFFAVRTSYEHGSREPLLERAAVIVKSFKDAEILKLHNAIPCPEQTGKVRNCGECGLCWLAQDKNIAFAEH